MYSTREIDFKYDLYDKEGVFKRSLYNVTGAKVDYNSMSALKSSAVVEMEDSNDIDFFNDQIRIFCIIDGVEYPLGQFLISAPRKNDDGVTTTRDCQCYSKLLILQEDGTVTRKSLPIGTNVIAEVKRMITPYGLLDIPDLTATTSTAREWEIGTSLLTIINELLASVNYTSLDVDKVGKFVAKPYVLPTDREIEITYEDNEASIIYQQVSTDIDMFGIPNKFVRYTNSADINPAIIAIYENNNADSPTSIANRGRVILDAKTVSDAPTQAILNDICKRDAYQMTDKYQYVEFSTAINPIHGFMNCLYLKVYAINDKLIETDWSIYCRAGGEMTHRARKVVNI